MFMVKYRYIFFVLFCNGVFLQMSFYLNKTQGAGILFLQILNVLLSNIFY